MDGHSPTPFKTSYYNSQENQGRLERKAVEDDGHDVTISPIKINLSDNAGESKSRPITGYE